MSRWCFWGSEPQGAEPSAVLSRLKSEAEKLLPRQEMAKSRLLFRGGFRIKVLAVREMFCFWKFWRLQVPLNPLQSRCKSAVSLTPIHQEIR